jgi:hypothetical protein
MSFKSYHSDINQATKMFVVQGFSQDSLCNTSSFKKGLMTRKDNLVFLFVWPFYITSLKSIPMFCGIDNIPHNIPDYSSFNMDVGIFRGIQSVSQNTVVDLNNVIQHSLFILIIRTC